MGASAFAVIDFIVYLIPVFRYFKRDIPFYKLRGSLPDLFLRLVLLAYCILHIVIVGVRDEGISTDLSKLVRVEWGNTELAFEEKMDSFFAAVSDVFDQIAIFQKINW